MKENLNTENNKKVRTEAQIKASKENGKKGGRPRISKPLKTDKIKIVALVPEINRQAYAELSRSASNLNQIARRLNQKGKVEIEEIYKALQGFRLSLLGIKQ
jgi:DNA invertase Pin-like site-specific DNA recombinase